MVFLTNACFHFNNIVFTPEKRQQGRGEHRYNTNHHSSIRLHDKVMYLEVTYLFCGLFFTE